MRRIEDMHVFDYRFLKDTIPASLAGLSDILYDLRARDQMRRSSNLSVFQSLRKAALIESVESSNAIEGIVTTGARIKEIVQDGAAPHTHDEQEIFGYKNALQEIYDDSFSEELSEELVCHFHRLLLQITSPEEAGLYKKENNWIQERSPEGRIRVRFIPTKAKDTKDAMEQWILAYHEARQESGISRLFLVACAIVDFLCIHPFTDGNGRVSRILTTMLLQQNGFDIGRYISLEGKINEYKGGYYDALKQASEGWHENKNDYTPFMIFLAQVLYACYKDLDMKFIQNSTAHIPKSRQVEALLLETFVPVSKEEIVHRLPDISVTTVERVLGKMVKEGTIVKIGTYRNARYKKA